MNPFSRPLRSAALAGALALLAACSREAPPPPADRLVVAHLVAAGEVRSDANYSGEVRPRHETPLAFRIGGKLTSRLVDVGQAVAAGQVLARLDPADAALGASAAQANLAAARADLTFAAAERERYRGLRERNFVSQAALEAKEAAWQAAQGRLDAATAQAGLAGNQNAYAVLCAETAGVVSAVLAEAGQVVAAGQPVLRLARPGEMEVAIAVPENRVGELQAADRIRIGLWAQNPAGEEGGKEAGGYAGRVREIAPMADPVTRTYAVRVSLLEPDAAVRLGMTATVRLGRGGGKAALVPATAIFQQAGKPAVWVIGADGRVALRPVEVAQFREDGALVSAGLAGGERIVAAGVHKLAAGETVRVAP